MAETRAISATSRRELSSRQGAEGNSPHSERNIGLLLS